DEGSVQNTNSWGLRGAEPDPSAAIRGIVLGDSFMQGMFNGDSDTPPVDLERYLQAAWKVPVSILNTGHIGYSPEQYYYALREYGDGFRPQFVVVSVCPNDFGDGPAVLRGEGDWYKEAEFWLDEIRLWCNSRSVIPLVVSVPTHLQVERTRQDALYPGRVCDIVHAGPLRYCSPLDQFIDEHLRLAALPEVNGQLPLFSKLYNRTINDDHFSPVRTGEIGNSRSGTWVTVSGLIGLPCAILKRDCSAEATFPLWLASSAPARQEGFPTAMHNFELGTAPGFSLLPPCRLQHLVDRRMS